VVKTKKFIVRISLIISGVGTLSTLVFDHATIAEAYGMMFREEETMILTWVKASIALLGVLFLLMSVNPEKHRVLLLLCTIHAVFITLYSAFSWMITGKEYPLITATEGILSVLLIISFVLALSLPKKTESGGEHLRREFDEEE